VTAQEVKDAVKWGNLLPLLAISRSIASIVALVIVFIEKVALREGVEPQFAIWQVTFALLAVLAMGTTGTIIAVRVHRSIVSSLPLWRKTLSLGVTLGLGAVLLAIFLDGTYAALYWHPWALARIWHVTTTETSGPRGVITDLSRLRDDGQTIQADNRDMQGSLLTGDQEVEGYYVDVGVVNGDCGGLSSTCIAEVRSSDFRPVIVLPRVFIAQVPLIDLGSSSSLSLRPRALC
jgi:hypothetical protein